MNGFRKDYFASLTDRIRKGEPLPKSLAAVLSAFTPVARVGMALRKLQSPQRVNAHVISFGNLTVGGTGKTPAVIERAIHEVDGGKKVAVLTRGYGARRKGILIIPPNSLDRNKDEVWLGDEPELIRRKVPQVTICKCVDRVEGARRVIEEFGCDVLILDDGFQYVRLERDENVLVIDATNPFGNGKLIPRGILREPLSAMSRATHVILTKCDLSPDLNQLLELLKTHCPSVPIRTTRHAPCYLLRVHDQQRFDLSLIRGQTVAVVCAIGNPEAFVRTVEKLGAQVGSCLFYRDHAYIHDLPENGIVVTTEKDAIKMKDPKPNVFSVVIQLEDIM